MDERTPPLQPTVEVDSIAPTGLDQGDAPPGASSGAINLHRLDPLIGSSSFGVDLMYKTIKSTPNDEGNHE